jgi:glutathione S-transferase
MTDDRTVVAPCIVGRSSSHYTRVVRIFAAELGVVCSFVPVYDLTSREARDFGGNPALKLPVLTIGEAAAFGAENICRTLAEMAPQPRRIVWTEQLPELQARNAQELVWHGMQAQVQLVFGTQLARLPADNIYFDKAADGLHNVLAWLDARIDAVLHGLPAHDISLLEVSLFCLLEHLAFRPTLSLAPYPRLAGFAEGFRARPSAQRTAYVFDVAPGA